MKRHEIRRNVANDNTESDRLTSIATAGSDTDDPTKTANAVLVNARIYWQHQRIPYRAFRPIIKYVSVQLSTTWKAVIINSETKRYH